MKKILIFAFISLFALLSVNSTSCLTVAEEVIYAKIDSSDAYMYSSPTEAEKNKLFLLPETYFVKLISKANNNFYYCSYKDLKGYVKQTDVLAMNGVPAHPYLEGLFRIISLEGLGLYSSPEHSESKLMATIPYLTDDLIFYGSITGQELVPDNTNQWIYCKFNEGSGICGYVYSTFCDKIPKATLNNESFEIIENPFTSTSTPHQLSPVAMGFIIVGVAIPCLIVLFLLVKPTLLKDKLNSTQPKIRARRNRDYFEFDDSDLN